MGNSGRSATKISTIAARQHGHITRAQLLDAGVHTRAIGRRIEAGHLIVVHPGVYAVEYDRPEPLARAAAAVLACGWAAVLSHESAAALWGLRSRWPDLVEITVAGDRRRPGIVIHRSTTLTRRDVRHHLGIPVTSPARTLLDIAAGLEAPALARAVNDARLRCALRPGQLAELLQRLPHHPGTVRLRSMTETPRAPTRSAFEDAFLVFASEQGLPEPRVNSRVAGYEADVLFATERVIVELDGYEFHRAKTSFESDRDRDAALLEQGFVTVRITWERFTRQPAREAQRLRAILQARR